MTKSSNKWSIVFLSWSCLNAFMNTYTIFVNNLATNEDENLQMLVCFPMQQWCSEHLKRKFTFIFPVRFLNMFVFHKKQRNNVQVLPKLAPPSLRSWDTILRYNLFWPLVNFKQGDLTWFVALICFWEGGRCNTKPYVCFTGRDAVSMTQ